ncbi:FAD-binding oxidoreductase [Halopseudomonas formosensis]|uniref:4-cresol dehydrogenase (Hydroxylating) n=1 Tax=Halopseudomonas formosensis TaxID=1002526 RepID=A0A1I6A0Y4_9GAMM|nr:FAD-binding oxidoreductase [Halopseudomonas formosensis]MDX9687180.1 FAD-binding oxidoreductase [Halopseudomonas formosensis]SFQ62366.1 4-cresol dehydrogenase (hydroxylating) [Halopseudomonas formosensis]
MSEQNNGVLPRGVTQQEFNAAVEKFRALLGNENVLVEQQQLVPYNKIMMSVENAAHAPSAAVTATTVEQVQGVVKICNEHRIPIWTISTGRNFGYGSAAPGQRGQVILDLKKMNRIIKVDPEMCYALVEPGVTYGQLYDYIQENNLPVMLSFSAPSAIAGPVGNTMDRGVGYTPYGEHFMMQCGMEVVLANGDVYRTGMGGVKGSNTWQIFKWGYGPTLDGMFTQSNYGICTKMGFWLMPKPPVFKPFEIIFENEEDIVEIVEVLRPLRIRGIIPNSAVIANILWEAGSGNVRRSDYITEPGHTPDEIQKQIQKDTGMGAWNLYAALYGTQEQVDVNWKIIVDEFKKLGKGRIVTQEEAGDTQPFKYRAELMSGVPNLQEFGLYNWRGGGGSMWFAPVSEARGSECRKQAAMAKRVLHKYGLDYVAEFIVAPRDMHHVIDVLYDRTNEEETQRADACFAELLDEFEKEGYAVYRVNTRFQERVAQSYGKAKRDLEHAIKRAVDPNNILAPGRSGIDLDTYKS